jgi:hypothetical protein
MEEKGGFVEIGFEVVVDEKNGTLDIALGKVKGPRTFDDGSIGLTKKFFYEGRGFFLEKSGKANGREPAGSAELAAEEVKKGKKSVFDETLSRVLLEGAEMEFFEASKARSDEGDLVALGGGPPGGLENGNVSGRASREAAEGGEDDDLHLRWGGPEGVLMGDGNRRTEKSAGLPSLP